MAYVNFYNSNIGEIGFNAYLTNFSDSHKVSYDEQSIVLNPDVYRMFKNSSRALSLSFDVIAGDQNEAKGNMEAVNRLILMLYPKVEFVADAVTTATAAASGADTKTLGQRIGQPPIVKILYYNLIKNPNPNLSHTLGVQRAGLNCKLYGVDVKPQLESGFFKIEENILLPKLIKLDIQVSVVLTKQYMFPTSTSGMDGSKFNPQFPYTFDYSVSEYDNTRTPEPLPPPGLPPAPRPASPSPGTSPSPASGTPAAAARDGAADNAASGQPAPARAPGG